MRKFSCWKEWLIEAAMVNSEVNITVVKAMASTAIRLRVRAARSPLSERLRIQARLETFMPPPPYRDSIA